MGLDETHPTCWRDSTWVFHTELCELFISATLFVLQNAFEKDSVITYYFFVWRHYDNFLISAYLLLFVHPKFDSQILSNFV